MVAAYDENGTVDVMNAAWGMICSHDKIALFIDEDHKTTKNIRVSKAFTVSLADKDHMDAADFFGIATGNKMPDKFEKSGYHAEKSAHVNAPIVTIKHALNLQLFQGSLKTKYKLFRMTFHENDILFKRLL